MSLTSPDLMGEVRRLPYDGGLRLGFDIGGTQTCSLSSRGTYESYVSSQHPSVADIIALSILREGCRPGKIVLAPAGPRIDPGVVMMTNVKRWPLIVTAEIERQLGGGTRVCDVNDMAAKAAGHAMVASVSLIGPEALDQQLESESKLVVTVSTGVGDAAWTRAGILMGEGGHGTWQPEDVQMWQYLQFLQAKYGVRVSVEQAISGKFGLPNLLDYFSLHRGYRFDETGGDVNRSITEQARVKSGPCREMMRLHAAVLGQYLRNRVLAAPICYGGVYLTGGVMSAECVRSDWYLTELGRAFVSYGAEHTGIVAKLPVRLVTDDQLGVKGALELAKQD